MDHGTDHQDAQAAPVPGRERQMRADGVFAGGGGGAAERTKRRRLHATDPEGGEAGDAHLKIRVDPGENRRWENGSLIQEVAVPYSTLKLGGKGKITTPSGKTGNLNIQPNSRIGDRRRMAKRGFDGENLDLELILLENEELTDEQKNILDSLRDSGL